MDQSLTVAVLGCFFAIFVLALILAYWSSRRATTSSSRRYRISSAGRYTTLCIALVLMSLSFAAAGIAFFDLQNLNRELTPANHGEIIFMCLVATAISVWTAVPPIIEWAEIHGDEIIWNPALGARQSIRISRVEEATMAKHANSFGVVMHAGKRTFYLKASLERDFWMRILETRQDFPFTTTVRKALKLPVR